MKQSVPIALALRGVSKRFDRPAVDALDLTVYGGEFYVLVGPNGAGKTTTLRMVVGLLRPDAGSICVEGIDARPTRLPPSRSLPGSRTSR